MIGSKLQSVRALRTQAEILIMPGEHAVSWEPAVLSTLLGSCVAACLWDCRLGIGGMNHFLLPDTPDAHAPNGAPARYGLYAMERLINDLMVMGSRRADLQAKVFGGANMTGQTNGRNLGQRNADFVRKFLRNDGIRLKGEDLGGESGRRIQFHTKTGTVKLMKIPPVKQLDLIKQEKSYQQSITQEPPVGEVTFF